MTLSALTAALGGAGAAPNFGPKSCWDGASVDSLSFPCLVDRDCTTSSDDGSSGFESWELRTESLHGSVPTAPATGKASAVDYELSPFQLRGGKEVLPKSLKDTIQRNLITEAVIGSLPKGLSLGERLGVSASTPLSTTLHRLSSLPSNTVYSRTKDGKRLRRHVLHGTVLVFITAGYSGKRFVFERAKELGVRSVILDGPESWSKVLVGEGVAERFIEVDMSDAATVFDRCLDAIKRVKEELGDLDGVLSFSEMAMPLVARLAERLGLPGNTPAAVDAARDKHATRLALDEAGLPTSRHFLITSHEQLQEASEAVEYPAVIKPVSGAASIGVVRVDSFEQLQVEYVKVCKEMAAARIVAGALQQGDSDCSTSGGSSMGSDEEGGPEEATGSASAWIKTTIMMEEYLDGPEVDVDLVFSEGQPVYGSISDNWPTLEPYFNETGSNIPSTLPMHQQRELVELSVKSVQALGFESGVFHVESKYTSRGPRLIEVNCRMGGGSVRNMNLLTWGVDLVEEQLLCTAGIPSRPIVAPKPLRNIAEFCVNAMRTGILRDTKFLDEFQGDPDILYARTLVEQGSKVVCVEDGLPTWVCETMVTKPTIEEAIEFVKKVEARMQETMPIDPLPTQKP